MWPPLNPRSAPIITIITTSPHDFTPAFLTSSASSSPSHHQHDHHHRRCPGLLGAQQSMTHPTFHFTTVLITHVVIRCWGGIFRTASSVQLTGRQHGGMKLLLQDVNKHGSRSQVTTELKAVSNSPGRAKSHSQVTMELVCLTKTLPSWARVSQKRHLQPS